MQNSALIYLILVILSLCWLLISFVWLMRKRRECLLDQFEQEELEQQELRMFFSLKKGFTDAELTKSYHQLAKRLHPDAGGKGEKEAFTKLQAKYERAKKIFFPSS